MKPFTDNIIFFDAEFTSLDPYHGEILSLALVKPSGEELSLELDVPESSPVDPWVIKNVYPFLTGVTVSRETARERIREFVGSGRPHLLAYVYPFDSVFLHRLFNGVNKWPFHWLPLDFASMLHASGYDPEKLFDADDDLSGKLGVPKTEHHRLHDALNDARLLREVYFKLFGKPGETLR